MNRQIVNAYVLLKEKIKEQQKVLAALKKEEKILVNEIQDYLNQTGEDGIKIDEHTAISLINNDKKINRNAKAYKTKLVEICTNRGIYDESDFVKEILRAKVETTVQQQKLKIHKTK